MTLRRPRGPTMVLSPFDPLNDAPKLGQFVDLGRLDLDRRRVASYTCKSLCKGTACRLRH